MYAKRIIPCLDVKNGRVVKGMSFVNLVDAGNPVEAAIQYDKEGADELVLLDITATSDGRDTMVDIVEKVANSIVNAREGKMKVESGGGGIYGKVTTS